MIEYRLSFSSAEKAYNISDDIFKIIIDTIDTDLVEKNRLRLIVSELYMNAYVHGNEKDPAKVIDVVLRIGDGDFTVIVKDQGPGVSEQKFKELADSVSAYDDPSGRGIKIVHKLCDKVQTFRDNDDKSCVRATRKYISKLTAART